MDSSTLLLILSSVILVITCVSAADLYLGIRKMIRLSDVPLAMDSTTSVSIVIPACNEEENVAEAIVSHLNQDYANCEIIVINDRSTDTTGRVLDELKEKYPQLIVIHNTELPDGWMGKAHALQLGAQKAGGDLLLFTDGDIVMEQSTISRAVSRMNEKDLDHLTLLFRNTSPGLMLNSLILESGAGLLQMLRPWKAVEENSKNYVGVGAFNLVKKSSYEAIGGHERFKMHPIDDIMLGKAIKRSGFSQECMLGIDIVTVPWYSSVGAMVNGLMKNILAVINYRFILLPPLVFFLILLTILPFWGIVFAQGEARYVFALVEVVRLSAFYAGTKIFSLSPWCTAGTVLVPYIKVYILLRAAWCNIQDRGIQWRGTHYPLEQLQKNEPLFF